MLLQRMSNQSSVRISDSIHYRRPKIVQCRIQEIGTTLIQIQIQCYVEYSGGNAGSRSGSGNGSGNVGSSSGGGSSGDSGGSGGDSGGGSSSGRSSSRNGYCCDGST